MPDISGMSGLILICGIILFVHLLITGIYSSVDMIDTRVIVPGTQIIELNETGRYTIYFEYSSVIDGKVYESKNINGLMCSLKNVETGELIKLNNSKVNSNYAVSGREGKSIFYFDIDKAGKYEINGWYKSGKGEETVLAIGKGFTASLICAIFLCIGTLFITIGS